ncbi:MAG: NYN domain-containing protein [Bryobacteraceae bacterium]|nr:NYN domain-containing protein [Bryobacteraceae bacterium]
MRQNLSDSRDISDVVAGLIQRLRRVLLEKYNEEAIILEAYADFERIDENAQGALYLIGVETHNVLGTDHKNAADMRLCIDALTVLYTRQEIRSFIVVAGDRDYIPVIQHLKKHGRTVRVVGFPSSMSGDLLTNVGQENFLDATQFLPQPKTTSATTAGTLTAPGQPSPLPPPVVVSGAVRDPLTSRFLDEDQNVALNVLWRYFHNKPEVWMTPYLHKLRAELPQFSEYERKALIAQMAESGAIRVEKRKGEPHDFSVILVNWNHAEVRKLHPG